MKDKVYWRFKEKTDSSKHGYESYINRGEKFYNFLFAKVLDLLDHDKDIRILEIGSSVGGNLMYLHNLGYKNLCGIDISIKAIEYGRVHNSPLELHCQDALDFLREQPDNHYDLIFTVGCLINIPDEDVEVYHHIHRCSKNIIMHKERDLWLIHNYNELMDNCELVHEEIAPGSPLRYDEKRPDVKKPGSYLRIYKK